MADGGLSAAELLAVAALWKRTGRVVEARFTGDSMRPAIASGARLRLRCGAPVAVGDVAAFVRDGHVLVHRVVARLGPQVVTRGDALVVPDPPQDADAPFARVDAVQHADGWRPPPAHADSAAQRVVLAACRALGPRGARGLIKLLRRLRSAPPAPVDVEP